MRDIGYWFLDALKGGEIKSHYNEVKFIQENNNSRNSREIRAENLIKLLQHAVNNTPFYKKYIGFESIRDFGVINKGVVKENFQDFISVNYNINKLTKVSTSGSTGVPFKLYQCELKRKRLQADLIYFLEQINFKIGQKLYVLEVWSETEVKSRFYYFLRNLINIDVLKLTDHDIADLLNKLKNDKSKKGIVGFASALEKICKYLDKIESEPLDCNIVSITAGSEYLNEYTRNSIKKYFGIDVVSRYSTEEFGILGQRRLNSSGEFQINWSSHFIEIFDKNKDEPVPLGMPGRVIVTDLFNYAMPMIRYDTGDIAVMNTSDDTGELVLQSVHGRIMDVIYNTKGEMISSFLIYCNFTPHYNDLNQYQFIQEGEKDYRIKLNPLREFSGVERLISDFRRDLGQDAKIKIDYVNDIPTLSSGKTRMVMNVHSVKK